MNKRSRWPQVSLSRLVSGAWLLGSISVMHPAAAAEPEQPPICSSGISNTGAAPPKFCTVTPLGGGYNAVEINLTAETWPIEVGGYTVITDNYNRHYLTPIVEAKPGDTVMAKVVNILNRRTHDGMADSEHDWNPTNLHYFHGGIVSPANALPLAAEDGRGDNVYVYSRSDKDPNNQDPKKKSNSFELSVPIPLDLDARALEDEQDQTILHPFGLNWYHSHMHGISSTQVMGGMSGLLSVGEATANVNAACKTESPASTTCLNDVNKDTDDLKKKTKVYYAMLRDISLTNISKRPDEPGNGTADWDFTKVDFPQDSSCKAWDWKAKALSDKPEFRLGYCQRDEPGTAWLFTLNGQRYPTIHVKKGENLLVRMGNVSSNVGYDLALAEKDNAPPRQLTILSLDGVVPAGPPVPPEQAGVQVAALSYPHVLLMPASRVEFYIRNDDTIHPEEQHYVLRTNGVRDIGNDEWPQIQLAEIVLEPNDKASDVRLALNALIARPPTFTAKVQRLGSRVAAFTSSMFFKAEEEHSLGCVRDLNPALNEYRRVTFIDGGMTTTGLMTDWSIRTEIIQPAGPLQPEKKQPPDASATIAPNNGSGKGGVPFEEYDKGDGTINWETPKHVCIHIDHSSVNGAHKQLWVLYNGTGTLHNFHIHQMKFRLATKNEIEGQYHIDTNASVGPCGPATLFKCFDDLNTTVGDPKTKPIQWHDTIPVPAGSRVFIVMSFDAIQQVGRFVFHCHILKHEDKGLMAPIEVWGKP